MATRESQGLQIALILLVMITLLLAVTTFLYYRKSEERAQEVTAATEAQTAAEQAYNVVHYKVEALKQMIGAQDALEKAEVDSLKSAEWSDKIQDIETIETSYQQDMAMFGEGLDKAKLNYRGLVDSLGNSLRQLNQDLVDQADAQKNLFKGKEAFEKQESDRAKAALAAQQAAEADLGKVRADYNSEKERIDKEKEALAARVATSDERVKKMQDAFNSQVQTLTDVNSQQKNTITLLEEKVTPLEPEEFERPDGEIASVNQRQRTVWINLGRADMLRPQITFNVYAREVTGIDPKQAKEAKGSVEVLRVMNEHMSEARIIDDDDSDPILRGDKVHTAAWRPGRRVHFALAGLIDVTGNGRSDRELVRNLIHRNQGVIDAELLDDGTPVGELTSQTRYLVYGEKPITAGELLTNYTNLIEQAQTYGIRRISVDEFLSYIGWKGEVRTIGLGKGADSKDFLKPQSGAASGAADAFRDRRPPERGAAGAF
jgi:hypothetical protein